MREGGDLEQERGKGREGGIDEQRGEERKVLRRRKGRRNKGRRFRGDEDVESRIEMEERGERCRERGKGEREQESIDAE